VDVIGQVHYPAYLAPEREPPLFTTGTPFWFQGRSGRFGKEKNPIPLS